MNESDKEKIAFITKWDKFYYLVMPFGLRVFGSTFQKLMDKVFKNQVGQNVLPYVENILVKLVVTSNHAKDIDEILCTLAKYGIRLNTTKCMFRVEEGKFLRFYVGKKEIHSNPDKVSAILKKVKS